MTTAKRKPKPTTDRGRLEALRDRLAGIIDSPETSPRDVVSASREYRIVVAALGQTAPPAAGSKLDEIAARRRRRAAR
ncbi:hypothetical protein [Mycolicibacterium chlorophenolicum]|uniref:hypothetical protein n=1 Tax=Mycolicibacterium chlorophenolicum TaxID=37916 RepID=UPI000AC88BAF|nr:hypothetical protein [Mycolicibacterium chlorophenolicum]